MNLPTSNLFDNVGMMSANDFRGVAVVMLPFSLPDVVGTLGRLARGFVGFADVADIKNASTRIKGVSLRVCMRARIHDRAKGLLEVFLIDVSILMSATSASVFLTKGV